MDLQAGKPRADRTRRLTAAKAARLQMGGTAFAEMEKGAQKGESPRQKGLFRAPHKKRTGGPHSKELGQLR